jgi:hypothetical protein
LGTYDPFSMPCSASRHNYHDKNPIAWSMTTDPKASPSLDFFMDGLLPF